VYRKKSFKNHKRTLDSINQEDTIQNIREEENQTKHQSKQQRIKNYRREEHKEKNLLEV